MMKKFTVYIALGLLLCPPVLDFALIQPASADFINPDPFWISIDEDFSGAVAWGDIDSDGDLDLAVGNYGYNYIYFNDNGTIPAKYSWKSDDSRDTFSLTWVDFDSDGDIDLAAGNRYSNDTLYLNENGNLLTTPVWNSTLDWFTRSVKWADFDCDGDLDLAAGHYTSNVTIYENNNGKLTEDPVWYSKKIYYTNDIEVGDINGDSRVDLIVGNGKIMGGSTNVIFFNHGSGYLPLPNWESQNPRRTMAMDLGDYDIDGDLDLAVGTLNQGTFVHYNINNNLTVKASWTAGDTSSSTWGITWADVTGSGYLDLILAINGENAIYKNTGGTLESHASWFSTDSIGSSCVAAGDYDADADLDLAFSSDLPSGEANKLYHNNGTVVPEDSSWSTTISDRPYTAGWYDVDSDGNLDLAIGTTGKNRIFYNKGSELFTNAGWVSSDSATTRCLAWGDLDGDSDLDLITGNYGSSNVGYRNNYGTLISSTWWSDGSNDNTTAVALGDLDSDGDLDLAVGNKDGANLIYKNTGVGLDIDPSWTSNDTSSTYDLAWGDMDADGNLDLAVANSGSGAVVYLNRDNMLEDDPSWTSTYVNDTRTVSWGDMNGDGFYDLITGAYNTDTYVYLNNNGTFNTTPDWRPTDSSLKTTNNYIVDINADGALDIFEVNDGGKNRIFINEKGELRPKSSWDSSSSDQTFDASFGDMDSDGDFDIAVVNSNGKIEVFKNSYINPPVLVNNPTYAEILSPTGLSANSLYSLGSPYQGNIAVKYVLYDPEGASAWIKPEYSEDGGVSWHPATQSYTGGDSITGLSATPTGKTYTFLWDSKADHVISKNVMFRITVYSILDVEGIVQRPSMTTYTGLFPVDSPKIHPPLNLRVTGATTNSLDLEWTPWAGETIAGYKIYMNASYTDRYGPYVLQKTVGNITNETITGLEDGVKYFFKLRSFDAVDIHSMFSNIANGTTIPLNLPPRKLKEIPDIEMDEDTKLFNHLNLNDYFWDELQNKSAYATDGFNYSITDGEYINAWISPNEWLSIEPPPNYFGYETFTVIVNDSVFQANMTFNVTVNSINDRPILNLTDGKTIHGIQNEWINLTISAFDPADPHDVLKFSDNTTLFDIEAETGNISYNPLPWDIGTYHVNITVTDNGEPNLRDWATLILVINSTVVPPISEQPITTLVYPDNGATLASLKPTLMWDGYDVDSPEIWYDVYLAPDETLVHDLNYFARVEKKTQNNTFVLQTDLTNGLTYYWTVIPHDGIVRGTCASGIWSFIVDITQASPEVKLISPINRKIINTDTVRLTWELNYEGLEQVKYFVYFDTASIPKTLISSDSNEMFVDVLDLVDGEAYYWTVIPRAGNVIGTCKSGIWSFTVNFDFVQTYGVSLVTSNFETVRINETKLHDATIINEGNNVDVILVTLTAGTLEGGISLQSEFLTLTDIGSGFLELGPGEAVTISILFGIHDRKFIGIHTIQITAQSLGAQYADLYIGKSEQITVNVIDKGGPGIVDGLMPDGNNSTDGQDNDSGNNDEKEDPEVTQQNTGPDWCYLIFLIIFAIICVLGYSMYLMRKTRKKFEVYKTAAEILESKDIDSSAHPIVAGFLGSSKSKSGLGDVKLTASEAKTIKEAFIIGSGVYTQAEEELPILNRPYSEAAARMPPAVMPRAAPKLAGAKTALKRAAVGSKGAKEFSKTSPTPSSPEVAETGSYRPEYMSAPPAKPYKVATKRLAKALPVAEVARNIPATSPRSAVATPIETEPLPITKPVKKGAYQPDHIIVGEAKPYDSAAKSLILEEKLKEGKITKDLYEQLKTKYTAVKEAKPVKAAKPIPMAKPISKDAYQPDYMYISTGKPYDRAAKQLKLEQKYREGKISKRLYEELKSNYA